MELFTLYILLLIAMSAAAVLLAIIGELLKPLAIMCMRVLWIQFLDIGRDIGRVIRRFSQYLCAMVPASICWRSRQPKCVSLEPVPTRCASLPAPDSMEPIDGDLHHPSEQAFQLISGAWRLHPHHVLTTTSEPWDIGLALHRGPVRQHNEDYALTLKIGAIKVTVLADGCGGVPKGQVAAYEGCVGGMASVIRHLAWVPHVIAPDSLLAIALQAIYDASDTIRDYALRHGIDPSCTLRSTIIVTLTTATAVHYAYLGDGGGYVYRAQSGNVESFLEPQKAGGQLNYLAASLGASIEGESRCGSIALQPDDLVWICSDGVADRTDPQSLGTELYQAARAHGGDLAGVAQAVLDEFAAYHDDHGPVFDDNMSLILFTPGSVCPGSE
ncbi:MAG: protein phosphatase 2C domain-containing protein [Phycisphaeraceae bacterium]|nr:protein phosphatase 2C domain-containing protein [Phycisphaeraceae bacterium]